MLRMLQSKRTYFTTEVVAITVLCSMFTVACPSGRGAHEEEGIAENMDSSVVDVADVAGLDQLDAETEILEPQACSLDGWQPTDGVFQTSETTWYVALPIVEEHGCAQTAALMEFREPPDRFHEWTAQLRYTICNRCSESVAIYWMGTWNSNIMGEAVEPVDYTDEIGVGKGAIDLTASLVDPTSATIPAECYTPHWSCSGNPPHVLKRYIIQPGSEITTLDGVLHLSTWHDEISGTPLPDGTTAPYWDNPIDYFAPLALEVQIPRLWFLSTPLEEIVPEQQGDIACVTAGFLLNPECPTSLDDHPWSSDSLNVLRLENAALPPGLLEFLQTPRSAPSP